MKLFSITLWKPMKHLTQITKMFARNALVVMSVSLMAVSPVLIADGESVQSKDREFPSSMNPPAPAPGRNVTPTEFCITMLSLEEKDAVLKCSLYFRGEQDIRTKHRYKAFYI